MGTSANNLGVRQESLPDVLTADEVADILRASKYSVYRWAAQGRIPSFRIGTTKAVRFRREDIERIVAESQAEAS
jgi:excisionase family DNA binding protein